MLVSVSQVLSDVTIWSPPAIGFWSQSPAAATPSPCCTCFTAWPPTVRLGLVAGPPRSRPAPRQCRRRRFCRPICCARLGAAPGCRRVDVPALARRRRADWRRRPGRRAAISCNGPPTVTAAGSSPSVTSAATRPKRSSASAARQRVDGPGRHAPPPRTLHPSAAGLLPAAVAGYLDEQGWPGARTRATATRASPAIASATSCCRPLAEFNPRIEEHLAHSASAWRSRRISGKSSLAPARSRAGNRRRRRPAAHRRGP